MNHALVLEQDCSVNISGITVYIDAVSYTHLTLPTNSLV